MYARFFTFKSNPENRSAIEKMADEIYAYTKTRPGFISATYVISEDESEYGSFSVWDSQGSGVAAANDIREKTLPILEGLVNAAPVVEFYEVYKPK